PLVPLDPTVQPPENEPTVTQTVVVSEILPETPVTVTVYAPAPVEDVVVAVSTAVCAVVPLIVTGVGERLHVGWFEPFDELAAVTAHVSATEPVKEFDGVTVIVDVFPVVAPALTEMLPLLVRQ